MQEGKPTFLNSNQNSKMPPYLHILYDISIWYQFIIEYWSIDLNNLHFIFHNLSINLDGKNSYEKFDLEKKGWQLKMIFQASGPCADMPSLVGKTFSSGKRIKPNRNFYIDLHFSICITYMTCLTHFYFYFLIHMIHITLSLCLLHIFQLLNFSTMI